MREDRVHQFLFGGLEGLGNGVTLDHFSDFGADHVGPQKFAGLGVEDGFDEAVGFAQGNGLAVGDERITADLDLIALVLGRLFGEADAGDLRMAVGAAGDTQDVQRMGMQAGDVFDRPCGQATAGP